MSSSDEQIPDQSTIDEALPTEGEPNVDPTSPATAGIPPSDASDPVTPSVSSGESTQPEPDPTVASIPPNVPAQPATNGIDATDTSGSGSETEQVHRFRIIHEISNAGEEMAHSARTSGPMLLTEATEFLAELVKLGF